MNGTAKSLTDRFGLCQWFHFQDYRLLEATLDALDQLGVRHLRTGISWADYHRPGGRDWYDWQMAALRDSGVEVLLSVWHTPPSISLDPERGQASIPPARVKDYADFIDTIIERYGDTFRHVELWNEPNNPYKWNRDFDPDYSRFARLITYAGNWARERGKVPVLGGMTLVDHEFLESMKRHGALEYVDIMGIHAFPGMWEPRATDWDHPSHWHGWEHRITEVGDRCLQRPVWVTETGFATYSKVTGLREGEEIQADWLREALRSPAERIYWYTLFDLPPDRIAIEETNGGPREEAEYHMGLVRCSPTFEVDGYRKPAWDVLERALRDGLQEEPVDAPVEVEI